MVPFRVKQTIKSSFKSSLVFFGLFCVFLCLFCLFVSFCVFLSFTVCFVFSVNTIKILVVAAIRTARYEENMQYAKILLNTTIIILLLINKQILKWTQLFLSAAKTQHSACWLKNNERKWFPASFTEQFLSFYVCHRFPFSFPSA